MEIKVIKNQDDPLGLLRASIGGSEIIGFYLVYRGDIHAVVNMLESVLARAKLEAKSRPYRK
jgi:hypothetical protein